MFWLYEICYSCFRISRTPRDAEDLASIPFGVILLLPIETFLLGLVGEFTAPENDFLAFLLFMAYIVLPMVAGYYLIIKPFGYRKQIRGKHAVISKYTIGRKIVNMVLFIVLFFATVIFSMLAYGMAGMVKGT